MLLVAAVLLNIGGGSGYASPASAGPLDYQFGLFCCLTASGLSGLSGVLVQKALVGSTPQNPFVFTAELAVYGIVFLLISSLFSPRDRDLLLNGNLFLNWTTATFIPVTANVND
jgi:hypothetical protein